jgi:hypothetical protein
MSRRGAKRVGRNKRLKSFAGCFTVVRVVPAINSPELRRPPFLESLCLLATCSGLLSFLESLCLLATCSGLLSWLAWRLCVSPVFSASFAERMATLVRLRSAANGAEAMGGGDDGWSLLGFERLLTNRRRFDD